MEERKILDELILSGKVTEEDVEKARIEAQLGEKVAINSFHSVMCTNEHPSECKYYEEACMDNTWERPAHKHWVKLANDFIKVTGNKHEVKDLEDMIMSAGHIIQKTDDDVLLLLVCERFGIQRVIRLLLESCSL